MGELGGLQVRNHRRVGRSPLRTGRPLPKGDGTSWPLNPRAACTTLMLRMG